MPDPNKESQNLRRSYTHLGATSLEKVERKKQPQSKDYKFIGSQRRYSREFMAGFTHNGDADENLGAQKFKRKMNRGGNYSAKMYKVGRGKFPSRSEGYKGGV
jgi:hypothetical protein